MLIALLGFTGLNALGGGLYGLAGAPSVPRELLQGSPFSTFFVPSLVLLFIVGGSMFVALFFVLRRARKAGQVAALAGLILLGWVGVQVAMIGLQSFLQPVMASIGTAIALLGWRHEAKVASSV